MNSFQSQVLQPQKSVEGGRLFELLFSTEQFRAAQALLPPGLSLSSTTKNLRNTPKRPTSTTHLADSEPSHFEKRPAFNLAKNKISNSADYFGRCSEIIAAMKKHSKISPFLVPVDAEALGIPDYHTIITEPMDISTMEKKLAAREYKSFEEFNADMMKMLNNALRYNKPGTPVNKMADELTVYYERLLNEKNGGTNTTIKKASKPSRGSELERTKLKTRNSQGAAVPLNYAEKQRLSDLIRNKLPTEYLWDVWRIVAPGQNMSDEDLDFDIDQLSSEVARELQRFVESKISVTQKKKKKSPEEGRKPVAKPEAEPRPAPVSVATPLAPPVKPLENKKQIDDSSDSDILNSSIEDSNDSF